MVPRRALVIPMLAFLILLLVIGIAPAQAEEGDDSGSDGDAVASGETQGDEFLTGIRVRQACDAQAAVGQPVTYEITVLNTGTEPLKGIKVLSTLLGDLGETYADNLDVGGTETHTFTRVITDEDPDPVVNVIRVLTEGLITDESENDAETCATRIVPAGVQPIDQVVPPVKPVRQAVLPTEFLPRTGASLPGLAAAGFGFLMLGTAMVTRSYRGPRLALIGGFGRRLAGRSRWAWGPPPSWGLIAMLRSDRSGFHTRSHVMRRFGIRESVRRTEASGE